jgi:hypothetical protein
MQPSSRFISSEAFHKSVILWSPGFLICKMSVTVHASEDWLEDWDIHSTPHLLKSLTLSHTLPYTLICSKLFKILPQSIPNSPTPLLFFCSSFALQKQHGNVDLSKECRGRGANEETGQQCPLWPGKKRPATSPKSGRSSWHTAPLINIAQEIHRDRLQEHQNYLEDTRSN